MYVVFLQLNMIEHVLFSSVDQVLGILAFLSLVGHVVLTILTGRTDDQDGTKTSANR